MFTLLRAVHNPEKENNCKKHLQNFLYNIIEIISIFSEISHLNGLANKPRMPALLITRNSCTFAAKNITSEGNTKLRCMIQIINT
jgi:hypothetical protein